MNRARVRTRQRIAGKAMILDSQQFSEQLVRALREYRTILLKVMERIDTLDERQGIVRPINSWDSVEK